MKYKFSALFLAVLLSAETCLPIMANTITEPVAVEVDFSVRRDPETLSASEIIDELYAMEENDSIKRCAKDSSMILTGESPASDFYGTIYVGSYPSSDVFYHHNVALPIGKEEPKASIDGDNYIVLLRWSEISNAENFADNKNALNLLYNTVWDIKEKTAFMPKAEKVNYIMDIIRSHMSFQEGTPGNYATCLQTAVADCDGSSGLFYIIGINCGLKLKPVLGTYNGDSHAWLEVLMNDGWKVADTALNQRLISKEKSAQLGYIYMVSNE